MSRLKLVDDAAEGEAGSERPGDRLRTVQEQARILAREHVEEFRESLLSVAQQARIIAAGGDVFPVGVREIALRLSLDLPERVQRMEPLVQRHWEGRWPVPAPLEETAPKG